MLSRILILIVILIVMILFFSNLNASWNQQILQFSYIRFSALTACAVTAIIFSFALFSQPFRSLLSTYIGYFVAGLACTEIVLRAVPSLITDEVIALLPTEAREEIGAERGLFTKSNLTGSGMKYAYRPKQEIPSLPHVKIDSKGYRNPAPLGAQVDLVLLGGSIMLTLEASQDLGEHFRASGMSAVNLGMGSYGPFNWLDAYQDQIIKPQVKHRYVVFMVMVPDSLDRAITYAQVVSHGGDFRDYLRGSAFNATRFLDTPLTPWAVSIIVNLPKYLAQRFYDRRRLKMERVRLDLSWGDVTVPEQILEPDRRKRDWSPFTDAVKKLIQVAKNAGATPIMMFYPNYNFSVLPYVTGYEEPVTEIANIVSDSRDKLRALADKQDTLFIDLSVPIQENYAKQDTFVGALDYHPNEQGVQVIHQALKPHIQ